MTEKAEERDATVVVRLNSTQRWALTRLARRYPHGWHNADLCVRQDAKEVWFEADWVRELAHAVAKQAPVEEHP